MERGFSTEFIVEKPHLFYGKQMKRWHIKNIISGYTGIQALRSAGFPLGRNNGSAAMTGRLRATPNLAKKHWLSTGKNIAQTFFIRYNVALKGLRVSLRHAVRQGCAAPMGLRSYIGSRGFTVTAVTGIFLSQGFQRETKTRGGA
jgi:hypothetical protein